MSNHKGLLPKGYIIDDKYTVLHFIKESSYAETYRVKRNDGKLYFLKLINYSKVSRSSFDSKYNLLEVEYLKNIKHDNIITYIENNEILFDNKKYAYLLLNFISGETLAERICRERITTYYDIVKIITDILYALDYLHNLPEPIIHNEIIPQNIMLDLLGDEPKAVITDFGYARSYHQSTKVYNKVGLNLNYVAPECFNNLFSPQSDIFSVGVVMYQLIFGFPPWFRDITKYQENIPLAEEIIIHARSKPLSFPILTSEVLGYDVSINIILKKALSFELEYRFQSANEFIKALKGEINVEDSDKNIKAKYIEASKRIIRSKKLKGKGFDAIAGMRELKEQLKLDVIDALSNPEEYVKYGLTIPNGILLYGPPGCGKTYFAKCLAEEVNYEFISLTPASLKSKYINETQEKIARMFKEAETKAPIIIFIDEINELLPNRELDNLHEMYKSAVNEFLAQMDRTAEKGILIIGATNYPHNIDLAALRAGRFEKKFYIPPPDLEARKALFELYLKNRPLDFGIDIDKLAKLTENYVSADIEFLVNEAARMALKAKSRINMKIFEEILKNIKPSIPLKELIKYEQIKKRMDGLDIKEDGSHPQIGFIINNKNE